MKSLILALLLLSFLEINAQTTCTSEDLSWVLGSWKRTNVRISQRAYEIWKESTANRYAGIGFTLNGNDTIFSEKLSIVVDDGGCYYIADVPENEKPVVFALTELDTATMVFENPQHDFPNKITYYNIEGGMKVMVSGKGKSFVFNFIREEND